MRTRITELAPPHWWYLDLLQATAHTRRSRVALTLWRGRCYTFPA